MSTRSRRKPGRRDPSTLARFPLTAAIYLAFGATALAQDAPATPPAEGERSAATLDTVTVTESPGATTSGSPVTVGAAQEDAPDEQPTSRARTAPAASRPRVCLMDET